jgi:protocatechuate 3,4-dioxygenase beta subunit
MLELSLGLGSFAALGNSVFAQQAGRILTPRVDMGPFYPMLKPLDKDADLSRIAGSKTRAAGKIVHVTGRIVNEKGEPVRGAKIEIWQANAEGRYSHPADPNTAPIDPNFQGYAVITTDAEGRYRFKTVKPGAYPATADWLRPPHIHLDVSGKTDRLVTQMFFPDEPLNAKDRILLDLGSGKESAVAKLMTPTKEIEADAMLLNWDIVLAKG